MCQCRCLKFLRKYPPREPWRSYANNHETPLTSWVTGWNCGFGICRKDCSSPLRLQNLACGRGEMTTSASRPRLCTLIRHREFCYPHKRWFRGRVCNPILYRCCFSNLIPYRYLRKIGTALESNHMSEKKRAVATTPIYGQLGSGPLVQRGGPRRSAPTQVGPSGNPPRRLVGRQRWLLHRGGHRLRGLEEMGAGKTRRKEARVPRSLN